MYIILYSFLYAGIFVLFQLLQSKGGTAFFSGLFVNMKIMFFTGNPKVLFGEGKRFPMALSIGFSVLTVGIQSILKMCKEM